MSSWAQQGMGLEGNLGRLMAVTPNGTACPQCGARTFTECGEAEIWGGEQLSVAPQDLTLRVWLCPVQPRSPWPWKPPVLPPLSRLHHVPVGFIF